MKRSFPHLSSFQLSWLSSFSLVAALGLPPAARASDPPAEEALPRQLAWGLEFEPIPDVLRAHLPWLATGEGLLVKQVAADSPAARAGIRIHDVILEAGGYRLTEANQLPEPDTITPLLVIRAGHIQMLMRTPDQPWTGLGPAAEFPRPPFPERFSPPRMPPRFGAAGGASANSIARSWASGNTSIALSRVGDQISLEVASPATGGRPVQLQGTLEQIEQQIREQQLSPEAQQQIRDALRDGR